MPGSPDRRPSPADRPPVSRVGDELARLADAADEAVVDEPGAVHDLENEAVERARRTGWDHDLRDVDVPRRGAAALEGTGHDPVEPDMGRGAD